MNSLFIESSVTFSFNENQLLAQRFTALSAVNNGKHGFFLKANVLFQQNFILFQKIHIPDTFMKLERSRIWHFIFISVILFSGTQVECSALGEFIFKRCLGFSVELYQSINMYQTLIFPFFKKRSLISFYVTLVMLIIKKTLIWPFKKLVYWWEKSSKKIKLDLHFFVMWRQGMNDFINL